MSRAPAVSKKQFYCYCQELKVCSNQLKETQGIH